MKVIELIEKRFDCEVVAVYAKSDAFDELLYLKHVCNVDVLFSDKISADKVEFKIDYIAKHKLGEDSHAFFEEILPCLLDNEPQFFALNEKFATLSVDVHEERKLDELMKEMAETLVNSKIFQKVAVLLFNAEKGELRFTTFADIEHLSEDIIRSYKLFRIPATEDSINNFQFDEIKCLYSSCGSISNEKGFLAFPLMNVKKIYGLIVAYSEENANIRLRHTLSCTARFVTAMLSATILYRKYQIALSSESRLNKTVLENATLLTLGKYTANIVHEIKNPLISIGGFAQRLTKAISDPNLQKMARIISTEAERLERLTADILSFSNRHEVIKTPLNLLEEMLAIQMLFDTRSSENNIDIILDIPDNLILNVDHSQFRQVIVNIVANAMNAIESNGVVAITTFKRGNYYEISINDTGGGISDENMAKIFKPFFTTSSKGTGLGLAISKKIMKNHGGDIVVKRNDIGTTFILFVPLV